MKLEADPLLQMPRALAIGKCLRSMDSAETGEIFAAALALRRVLFYHNRTFADLANSVESWASYEREMRHFRDEAAELATAAMQAIVNADTDVDTDAGEEPE